MSVYDLNQFKYKYHLISYFYNNLLYQVILDQSNKIRNYVQETLADSAVTNYLETTIPTTDYSYMQQSGINNLCDNFTNKFTDISPCHGKIII